MYLKLLSSVNRMHVQSRTPSTAEAGAEAEAEAEARKWARLDNLAEGSSGPSSSCKPPPPRSPGTVLRLSVRSHFALRFDFPSIALFYATKRIT